LTAKKDPHMTAISTNSRTTAREKKKKQT
jgi:hypothetical protein